jgi:hypothetical protein
VAYDPTSRQLFNLTPRALYGFDADSWHCLWQRDKVRGERWPDDVGLYVHPQSNMVLGAWFTPDPALQVWNQERWIPVRMPAGLAQAESAGGKALRPGGPLPDSSANCLPSTEADSFISIDAARLAAMRMDVKRNRDEDRLLEAHWLSFLPANQGAAKFGRSQLPPDEIPMKKAAPLVAGK